MKKRYFILLIFVSLFAFMIMPNKAFATNRVIDGNKISTFLKTKKQIKNKWNSGKIDLKDNYSIFSKEQSFKAPYNGGVVKQEYLDNVLRNLNYYRYLIGSPEIKEKITNREDLQAGTVVQYLSMKSGNALTHWLRNVYSKPSDMSKEFYDLGVDADHNIISSYSYGAPVYPFFGESYFDYTSGHRVALLSPTTYKVQFGLGNVVYGDVFQANSNYSNMTNDFAAYPAPGYFPKQDFASESDWDIYLNANKFKSLTYEDAKNVVVTIKCVNTNKTYTYTQAKENLSVGTSIIHIKKPEKTTKYYEGNYEVYVKNLKDANGKLVDLKYTVKFYDKYEGDISDINQILYGENLISYVTIDSKYDDALLKKILPTTAYVRLDSGSYFKANISKYTSKNNTTYYGYEEYKLIPTFKNLPTWAKDSKGYIKKGIIVSVENQDYNRNYKYSKSEFKGKISKDITISATFSGIYKEYSNFSWVKKKGNTITKLKNSSKYKIKGTQLTIKNLTVDDEAEYYIVNTTSVPYLLSGSPMYISKAIKVTLTDKPKKVTGLKATSQTQNSITLNWKKVSGIKGYCIYQYNESTKKYQSVAKTTKNSYKVKKLKAGKTYKFKVVAYKTKNSKKYYGEDSNILKTTTKPLSTKFTKSTVGKNKVTLKWKKVSDVTGYQIYMATSKNGKYKKVKTITSSKTVTYTKKGLKKGQKYYFKIRAYRKVGGKVVYSSYSKPLKTNKIK